MLEFRASIIIGSGSVSFEMIRSLVERLPIMITPKWVHVPAQPIAIDDVLQYLVAALQLRVSQYRVYEIGGADVVSYADIMRAYARQRGIRLRIVSVPVLTPYVSSLWLGLVTPLYARIGRKLIESIVHSTVVRTLLRRKHFRSDLWASKRPSALPSRAMTAMLLCPAGPTPYRRRARRLRGKACSLVRG